MPTIPVVAKVQHALQTPRCPHCNNEIELYEPSDVDGIGLPWIKRKELNRTGELKPWAIVRGGKVWIYLKSEVEAYLRGADVKKARKTLDAQFPTIDFEKMSDQAVMQIQKQVEMTLRREIKRQGLEENNNEEPEHHEGAAGGED